MALSQSAVSELLEAFRTGDGVDLIRESVRLVMQELIEVEAAEHLGAARYERTPSGAGERNGSRPKLIATQTGDVTLAIPKVRSGASFFPSILVPRRRIDHALHAVVMEALCARGFHPQRRSAGVCDGRDGDLQVGGVADLRRPG